MNIRLLSITLFMRFSGTAAWIPAASNPSRRSLSTLLDAHLGIFYGTSTGSTQTAAEMIHQAFGPEVSSEPIDIDTMEEASLAQVFAQYDSLVVGTPTWNTGADTERSGTGWDELYYTKLPEIRQVLNGKKVAVFGLGDQISYSENYADASGELYDVFEDMGCIMLGAWSQEGYEHENSKAIRGDKFCGLMLDFVNQEELSEERVRKWVVQLKEEGILETTESDSADIAGSTAFSALDQVNGLRIMAAETGTEKSLEQLDEGSALLDATIAAHATGGFTPHTNPMSRLTMWTSEDGRKSFLTAERTTTDLNP